MTGKSKDYFSGRADAVDDAVRLLNNHAAMFTSQTSCVIAALAKQVETLKEGDDMALYRWLEQAAKSDYKEVSEAARTMMAYYQGAEFQTKDQESLAAQPDADGLPSVPSEIINAISHYGDERDGGTNSAQAFGDVVRLIRVELSRAQTAPAVDLASVSGEAARCIEAAAEFIQDISDAQPEIGHPELAERLRALLSRPSAPAPVSEQPPETKVQLAASRERRIYIAGPMTGIAEFNFPTFNDAASMLRAEGWHVENPADHGVVEGATWTDYLHYDLGRLATCSAIYLLPMWEKSRGAVLEVHIANALGMVVKYAPGAAKFPEQPAQEERFCSDLCRTLGNGPCPHVGEQPAPCGGKIGYYSARSSGFSERRCEKCGWRPPRELLDVKNCPRIPSNNQPAAQTAGVPDTRDKQIEDLKTALKNANANADMYANAWQRELCAYDGKIINKRHHIDAMVLTTRDLVERLRKAESALAAAPQPVAEQMGEEIRLVRDGLRAATEAIRWAELHTGETTADKYVQDAKKALPLAVTAIGELAGFLARLQAAQAKGGDK